MKYIFILLLPVKLFSQDITGIWTGTLYNDTTKKSLQFELAISDNNNIFNGYSHTIFVIDSIENIGVKAVSIKRAGSKILIQDEKLVYNNYPEPPAKGVRMYSTLSLTANDSIMTLTGTWKTNRTKVYKSLTGIIDLHKKINYKQTLIYHKLDSLGLLYSLSFIPISGQKTNSRIVTVNVHTKKSLNNKTISNNIEEKITPRAVQPASAIGLRKIETIQTVYINSDSLLLTLYDNGEIDGDTVSILLNGKVIMPMQGLTSKGISKTIYLTPEMGDSVILIMYAENLGSITPNTGLLVVHDGEKIYEIRFTGDLQKNSAIILRRKIKK